MKNKRTRTLIIILVILILASGGFFAYKISQNKKVEEGNEIKEDVLVAKVKEKSIKTFSGDDRPIAVMVDNHQDAWPQAGLEKAYMVYEIIAEGGETRLMALYKGQDVKQIGPVRSARPYFIDYAMENDAIYTHFGQSPQAEYDLKHLYINDINGIAEDGVTFLRTKKKSAPHNAMTSTDKLIKSANNKKYRIKSDKKSVLNYSVDDVNLENGESAKSITIPHSKLQTVKYEYDKETKMYKRYARKKEQKDLESGKTIEAKNIIVTMCDNYTLDDVEKKDRQGLKNIGTFDGYYLTNGKAIKIKCEKNKRDEQTKYLDINGNEIKVNDGNTWINICPRDAKIVIEPEEIIENSIEQN